MLSIPMGRDGWRASKSTNNRQEMSHKFGGQSRPNPNESREFSVMGKSLAMATVLDLGHFGIAVDVGGR